MTIRNPPAAPDTAGLVIDSTTAAYVHNLDVSTGAHVAARRTDVRKYVLTSDGR